MSILFLIVTSTNGREICITWEVSMSKAGLFGVRPMSNGDWENLKERAFVQAKQKGLLRRKCTENSFAIVDLVRDELEKTGHVWPKNN
jgi:hypothetical protein